jgi:hypothetical protein
MNKFLLFFLFCFCTLFSTAQLRARVTVLSNQVGSNVDKKTFQTLQTALNDFVNTKKWSSENFNTN